MARRGINRLLIQPINGRDTIFDIHPEQKNSDNPAWIENLEITHTNAVIAIMSNQLSFHQFIMSISSNIKIFAIKAFQIDRKLHFVKELYPSKHTYMCAFVVEDEKLKLMTIGSRTSRELSIISMDSEKRSRVPLLFYRDVVDGQFVLKSVNLTY